MRPELQFRFHLRTLLHYAKRLLSWVLLGWILAAPVCRAFAEEAQPYPRISEEAFKARLLFFDYDKTIPLEGRVVQQWDMDGGKRQKIVFRGAQGFLVPGYIHFIGAGQKPWPLVLLLHGWSGSKEEWYKDDN